MSTLFLELFTDFGTFGLQYDNPVFLVKILYRYTDNNRVPETQDDAEKKERDGGNFEDNTTR